jgi:hypothetical protein
MCFIFSRRNVSSWKSSTLNHWFSTIPITIFLFFVDIFFYPFLRKLDLLAEKTDFDITRLTGQPHPNLVQPDRFAHTSSAVCTSHQPHRAWPWLDRRRLVGLARRTRPGGVRPVSKPVTVGSRGGGFHRIPRQRILVDCSSGRCVLLCYCLWWSDCKDFRDLLLRFRKGSLVTLIGIISHSAASCEYSWISEGRLLCSSSALEISGVGFSFSKCPV